ncbi:MAG: copper chaperone PCu(A)C [Pseudomonadota bacterium]
MRYGGQVMARARKGVAIGAGVLGAIGILALMALPPVTTAVAQSIEPERTREATPGASVQVQGVWARATPGRSKLGAVYLTLTARGSEDDALVGAATPLAERVELHTTRRTPEGIYQMRRLPEVSLPVREAVAFKPGGMHVMLIGLKRRLAAGDRFSLRLTFKRAPSQDVTVAVLPLSASGPKPKGGSGTMVEPGMVDQERGSGMMPRHKH